MREVLGMAIGPALQGEAVLDRVPALPHPAWVAGRKIGDLRRARGPEGGREGPEVDLATMSSALSSQCGQGPTADGAGTDQHRVCIGNAGSGDHAVARVSRSTARKVSQARRAYGRRRIRCARVRAVPEVSSSADPQYQSAREAQRRD
jgi:hypothetical protein